MLNIIITIPKTMSYLFKESMLIFKLFKLNQIYFYYL
jgi:hypothetical protein